MNVEENWHPISPEFAHMIQHQARADFEYRVAAWSGGAFRLHKAAGDKWWPRTATDKEWSS